MHQREQVLLISTLRTSVVLLKFGARSHHKWTKPSSSEGSWCKCFGQHLTTIAGPNQSQQGGNDPESDSLTQADAPQPQHQQNTDIFNQQHHFKGAVRQQPATETHSFSARIVHLQEL